MPLHLVIFRLLLRDRITSNFLAPFPLFCRLVPHIITFLASHLQTEQHNLLLEYQSLVQKQIGLDREKNAAEEAANNDSSGVKIQLEELLPKIKDIAWAKKTPSVSSE